MTKLKKIIILERKATGETVLKSIENAINGRRSSDIGDPERRTINEIKESVIRVKTAPQMELIARGKFDSQEVLEQLGIAAVEKYDPDNPDLPVKVRARVDELAKKDEVPGIFYDKTTNKIFVDESITDDALILAGIAREWKISEDLKAEKGKENDEGKLKATVAGELAYDDMMKRSREGKTGSISTDELGEAVMDADSEVTSDNLWDRAVARYKKVREDLGQLGAGLYKDANKALAEGEYQLKRIGNTGKALYQEYVEKDGKKADQTRKNIADDRKKADQKKSWLEADAHSYKVKSDKRKEQIDKELKDKEDNKSSDKKKINDEKQKIEKELANNNCNGKCVKEQQKVYEDYITDAGKLLSCRSGNREDCNPNTTSELIIFKTDKELVEYSDKLKELGIRGNYRLDSQERIDRIYNNSGDRQKQAIDYENVLNIQRNSGKNAEILYNEGKITERQYNSYKKEKGYIDTVNSYSSLWNNAVRPMYLTILGAINEEAVNSYTGSKNTLTAKVPPATTNKSSGKSYANRNSVFINNGTPNGTVKINIETVGDSNFEVNKITNTYTGSSAIKVVNKVTGESFISKNAGNSFTTSATSLVTIGNTESLRNPLTLTSPGSTALIPYTAALPESNTSSIQFKSIIPPNITGSSGNGQQQIVTQGTSENNNRNYEFKVQDNSGSNGSSSGGSGFKKNNEPPVKDSGKTYTLESQDANWNFKSEIPRTAVKNSEGNYILGRNNEWNFDTKYNIPYVETGNKGQGLVSVPSYDAVTNDYSRNYDVFYRTISEKHYDRLLKSGNLPPSGETSIAEDARYSERYAGINLEFKLKPGTDKQFEKIGVRNNEGKKLIKEYPNMKESFTGWKKYGYIQFKEEGNQITRNLGDGKGLDIFNQNIKEINFRKEIIKNGKK